MPYDPTIPEPAPSPPDVVLATDVTGKASLTESGAAGEAVLHAGPTTTSAPAPPDPTTVTKMNALESDVADLKTALSDLTNMLSKVVGDVQPKTTYVPPPPVA